MHRHVIREESSDFGFRTHQRITAQHQTTSSERPPLSASLVTQIHRQSLASLSQLAPQRPLVAAIRGGISEKLTNANHLPSARQPTTPNINDILGHASSESVCANFAMLLQCPAGPHVP